MMIKLIKLSLKHKTTFSKIDKVYPTYKNRTGIKNFLMKDLKYKRKSRKKNRII